MDTTDAERATALRRVGLGHLSQLPERSERWDEKLTVSEQHRLALAHILLIKPPWVVSDYALDVLDEDIPGGTSSIFRQELSGTGVVGFARRLSTTGLYERVLHIIGPAEHVSRQEEPA